MNLEKIMKKITQLEKTQNPKGLSSGELAVSSMTDEQLEAETRKILTRDGEENDAIRAIVEQAKTDYPSRWGVEALKVIYREGLIDGFSEKEQPRRVSPPGGFPDNNIGV